MRVVRFVKTYRMYQPGERAGFAEAEAKALIAQGFAVDPDAAARAAEAPAAAAERKSMIAEAIAELPEDAYTKAGAPEMGAINALIADHGYEIDPVTAAERDAIWAEMQAQGD